MLRAQIIKIFIFIFYLKSNKYNTLAMSQYSEKHDLLNNRYFISMTRTYAIPVNLEVFVQTV